MDHLNKLANNRGQENKQKIKEVVSILKEQQEKVDKVQEKEGKQLLISEQRVLS